MLAELVIAGAVFSGVKTYQRRRNRKRFAKLLSPPKKVTNSLPRSNRQQVVNHHLAISTVALGGAVVGSWLFPPVMLVSVVGLGYLTLPVWQRAYQAVIKQRRVKREIIDSVALPGLILTGYTPAAAIGYWVYYLGQKLLADTESRLISEGIVMSPVTPLHPEPELPTIQTANKVVVPTILLTALAVPLAGPVRSLMVLDNNSLDILYVAGSLGVLNHLWQGQAHQLLLQDGRILNQLCEVDTVVFTETALLSHEPREVAHTITQLRDRQLTVHLLSPQPSETEPFAQAWGIEPAEIMRPSANAFAGRTVCLVGDMAEFDSADELPTGTLTVSLKQPTSASILIMDGQLFRLVDLFNLAEATNQTSQRTVWTALGAYTVGVGGLIFLHLGIYQAVLCYQLGMVVALSNAMWPRLKGEI